jgi:AcrR family transcriptional regulator
MTMKNKIIKTASILCAKHGIVEVSMEQLAEILDMPEDTLYMYFKDKEDLFVQCLEQGAGEMVRTVDQIEKKSKSALETVVKISFIVFRDLSTLSPAFYKDLKKYPKLDQFFSIVRGKFRGKCIYYFQKGAEEGSFIPGLDYEPIASIYVEEISALEPKYQQISIIAFLQGISTEKGLHELAIITHFEK